MAIVFRYFPLSDTFRIAQGITHNETPATDSPKFRAPLPALEESIEMNKMKFTLAPLALLILTAAFSVSDVQAQTFRTFVRSNGSDGNTASNCPISNPCRGIAAALTVTQAGGEIVILDTAGYGVATINQAVTITAAPGVIGFIQVPNSTSGLVVNPGAGNTVVLRNLSFNGSGATNTTGITQSSGRLIVENSSFVQLTNGINVVNSKADVIDCNFWSNGTAVRAEGAGFCNNGNVCTATTLVRIYAGHVNNNTTAFNTVNPGLQGCSPGFPGCATQQNRLNILLAATGQPLTNITGNTTFMTGSGTGCPGSASADPSNCQNPGTYSTGNNQP